MTRAARRTPRFCEALEGRRLLASAGTLLSYDFNAGTAWSSLAATTSSGVAASAAQSAVGTVDVEGSTTKTGAAALSVTSAPATSTWTSALASGRLALANGEANLGKLTLGFNLSATQARSVKVIVTSYDAAGVRTGARESIVAVAAVDSFQRFAIDLSTMTPSGAGTFAPTAPFVSFDFEIGSPLGWGGASTLRVDNVQYSKPAYYVSPIDGNDKDNGTTEALAFATIQKAIDASQPGDVVCIKGDAAHPYTVGVNNRNSITRGGTPAAWITLKNYPGQSPTISTEGWGAIQVGDSATSTRAATCYVEIRGLHVIGSSAKVGSRAAPDGNVDRSAANADQYGPYAKYLQPIDPATGVAGLSENGTGVDSRTNGNGLSVDGGKEANKPHDIRFADNLVEQCAGGGIGAGDADRIQIEDNVVRDNSYWDKYGTSGISILSNYSFEGVTADAGNTVARLVRGNVSSGNLHKEKWVRNDPALTQYSDGNGIIIDVNNASGYAFRTLVTNNVVFDNGGSGIHAYKANHVDIVNNASYLNSASPHLQYGMIFANQATDVRIYNNVMVAPVANTAAGEKAEYVTGGTTPTGTNGIRYYNNVYWGGNVQPASANAYNVGNVTADPKFVNASVDKAVANFRLQSTSPAVNRGTAVLAPYLDADGRPHYAAPDAGAYEFAPAAPAGVTLAASSDTGTPGDNRTNLNNASSAKRLSFVVNGTLVGATVTLYSDGVAVGSAVATGATTTVTTDGLATLADGARAIAAMQTFASSPSTFSPALAVVVETVRPTLVGAPVINAGTPQANSRSQVRTVTWTFSEPMTAGVASFALVDRDRGATIDLSSRAVAVDGNAVTLALDNYGIDVGSQLFLPDGNYELTLLSATDAAGNGLDPASGSPRFGFFKLLGDFNGTRGVTAADYGLWRAAFGQPVSAAGGDGGVDAAFDLNGSGAVTAADYAVWRSRFGNALAARDDDDHTLWYAPAATAAAAAAPLAAKASAASAKVPARPASAATRR